MNKSIWRGPVWEHKQFFSATIALMVAVAFGFVGYCIGMDRGFYVESLLVSILGLFGGIFGYSCGITMVYTSKTIASIIQKKFQAKNL